MLDQAAPSRSGDADDAPSAARPGRSVPLALVGAVAGVLVGAGIVGVLVVLGAFDVDEREPDAQDQLIAAYERSRNVTYAFDGEFVRTMPDGRRLESGAFVVQRPPDELRRQLGSTSGRLGSRRINCAVDVEGRFQCAPGAEVPPWDAMVADELDNLRSYFDPVAPVYAAYRLGGGCFELQLLARSLPDPPYGRRAELCFDGPTGAMRSIEIEHEGGAVDRLEAVAVRATVSTEDFRLEGQERYTAREAGS